jgi:hypothetical protein
MAKPYTEDDHSDEEVSTAHFDVPTTLKGFGAVKSRIISLPFYTIFVKPDSLVWAMTWITLRLKLLQHCVGRDNLNATVATAAKVVVGLGSTVLLRHGRRECCLNFRVPR